MNEQNNGKDLAFRDRVVEFIGTTTSTIKSVQKELKEIKDASREDSDKDCARMTALEKQLNGLKLEYNITKTKIAIWASIAGGTITAVIKLVGFVAKMLGVSDTPTQ